jgi:hypothetical protein
MFRRTTPWYTAGLFACAVGVALGARESGGGDAGWQEIAWPFPQDAWPAGRAFRCRSASCGGDLEVYLRPKLGFCANCAAGVTDDAEVDGVADLDMISLDFVPAGQGEQVAIGGMIGRQRSYTLRFADGSQRPAAGIAISRPRQCDLFVVASQGAAAGTSDAERAIERLVISAPMAVWIRRQLDS